MLFRRLKAQWRRLLKQNDMVVTNVAKVVTACCILHNICEIHGETFSDSWFEEAHSSVLEEPTPPYTAGNEDNDAQNIRQAFGDYIESNPLPDEPQ